MPDPSPDRPVSVVVLSGNPRPGSRTLGAATRTAELLAARAGTPAPVEQIDLALLADQVFAAERPAIDVALKTVAAADLLVVATPVYKASYTGLLKSFLDLYRSAGLHGVVAVPLVVSASPAHSLAGETHLRPLLVELGATVPTRSLALVEEQLGEVDEAVEAWLGDASPALTAALRIGDAR